MLKLYTLSYILIGLCIIISVISEDEQKVVQLSDHDQNVDQDMENKEVKDYFEGSICKNCKYCKFCNLCDQGCPCETKSKRRNCHMCKYCKYCVICRMCNTFCAPGSLMDYLSSSIVKAYSLIGAIDDEELSKDLFSVKKYIEEHEIEEKKINEM